MAMPTVELQFGKKLSAAEAEAVLNKQVKTSDDFQRITAEIEGFNVNGLEILSANKTEFVAEGDKEIITFVTRLVVRSGDAVVSYQVANKEGRTKEVVTAAIVNEFEDKLTSLFIEQGKVKNVEFYHNGETIAEKDFAEGLPNNDDYVEGQSLGTVTPEYNWGDGCYPGYRHCGRNCGDNGDYGGGTPINPYDTCCRTHDRCWAAFGTNNCACDCQLESCAKANWYYAPLALHTILLAYFPVSDSCKC